MKGFTLAEILVVIGVISIAGVIITQIFVSSIRGSNKAQILAALKQNGQITLEKMDKLIRGADNVVCQTTDTLVVENKLTGLASPMTSKYSRFKFITATFGTNGKVQQDSPTVYTDTMCSDPLSSPVTISDSNTATGASITSGSFSRNKSAGFKDVIGIQFNVSPSVSAPYVVSSNISPIPFSTSIVLR